MARIPQKVISLASPTGRVACHEVSRANSAKSFVSPAVELALLVMSLATIRSCPSPPPLVIATTQLPELLGVRGGGDDFFERIWLLTQQINSTHLPTLAVGLIAIGLLLAGERLLPGRPVPLFIVALSLLAVWVFRLDEFGVKIVGVITAGLPGLQWEAFETSSIRSQKEGSLSA